MHDILGLGEYSPPFAKVYAPVGEQMIKAFENYADEVRSGKFPPDTES
jgi:3-methyl-2-oxobutanoate hydroxymethyltransferase